MAISSARYLSRSVVALLHFQNHIGHPRQLASRDHHKLILPVGHAVWKIERHIITQRLPNHTVLIHKGQLHKRLREARLGIEQVKECLQSRLLPQSGTACYVLVDRPDSIGGYLRDRTLEVDTDNIPHKAMHREPKTCLQLLQGHTDGSTGTVMV